MLSNPGLSNAVSKLPTRPWRNRIYGRAIRFKHHSDLLGRNRNIKSGRFNVGGGARVLYLAHDYVSALHETQAIGGSIMNAWILFGVEVDLQSVVDLTDPAVQGLLQTTPTELKLNHRKFLAPSRAPTQELGESCEAYGRIDGLLYQSPIDSQWTNLAVFENALTNLGSRVTVNDTENGLVDQLP